MGRRPALKICIPLITGIIVGWSWTISLGAIGILLGFLALCYAPVSIFRWRYNGPALSLLPYLLLLLLGMLKITYDNDFRSNDDIVLYARPASESTLLGSLSGPPSVMGDAVRFIVEAETVIVRGRSYPVTGYVSVSMTRRLVRPALCDSLSYGSRIRLRGELAEVPPVRNPGEFDLRRSLSLHGIYARMYATAVEGSTAEGITSGHLLQRYVFPIRRSLGARIDSLFRGDVAAFLKGILIGDRSRISGEVKTAFINAGVAHILAVSGLHVGIVILVLLGLFQALRLPELLRTLLAIGVLGCYVFLTGATPSVVRSVLMAVLFLGGRYFGQHSDLYNIIAVSATVMLLIDTRQLFDPGFQLSYAAVLSLVYLHPRIVSLFDLLPPRLRGIAALRAAFTAFAVSLAAGIGTIPFTSYYFGKISVVSLMANIVVVPLSSLVLSLGMIATGISYCSTWVASVYAACADLLAVILLKCVDWFGNMTFAYVGARVTLSASVIFYLIIGLACNIRPGLRRSALLILTLVVLNVLVYRAIVSESGGGTLRFTALDVGQGDALVVEFPDGKTLIIDTGPRGRHTDAGNSVILPYLRERGIGRIDALVISHYHSDHLGGMPSLLRHIRVGAIYEPSDVPSTVLAGECTRLIDSLRIPTKVLRRGDRIPGFGNTRIYVLHPPAAPEYLQAEPSADLNDESVVLRIVYGEAAVVLSGDAESAAEHTLVSTYRTFLRSGLLKVGHHGSRTSSSEEYLRAVDPSHVIISVGARNKFRHPSPEVVQRFTEGGMLIARTDDSGAVIFETEGRGWKRVNWREY